MSLPKPYYQDEAVTTLLLNQLVEEEVSLNAASQQLGKCVASAQHHSERVQQLKDALKALGIEPSSSEK